MNRKFQGRYLHKVDEKGRLIIPRSFRDLLGMEFTVSKDVDFDCLTIHTIGEMNKIDIEFEGKSKFDKDARDMEREFFSNCYDCNIDKQGRVMIPGWLYELAGINKDVWILGVRNSLEIWDKEKYENRTR